MRIDGASSSYLPARSSRSGAIKLPANVQAGAGASAQSSSQGRALSRASGSAGGREYARAAELLYHAPLSVRAAQALACYSSTASFVSDADVNQLVGLDLYV